MRVEKIETKEREKFKPVTLEVTFENEDELRSLHSWLSLDLEDVTSKMKESGRKLLVGDYTHPIYDQIAQVLIYNDIEKGYEDVE